MFFLFFFFCFFFVLQDRRADSRGHRKAGVHERRRGLGVPFHHGGGRSFRKLFRREPLRAEQGPRVDGEWAWRLFLVES